MKFIFVDAENIGLNQVGNVKATLTDKVFVFTKNRQVIELSERKLFQVFSSYPTGSNQADFYIIGNLVGVLASLSDEQKKQCQFVLWSQDNALVMAFEFQCRLHQVSCLIALPPKNLTKAVPAVIKKEVTAEDRILNYFKRPRLAESVRAMVQLSKPDFTRVLNKFIHNELIIRDPKNKKKWVLKKSA
ncbi:hypothetical protein JQC92_19840 [Shewanella sp. 202IG2-18]|uniref:hypothetical protein n=1 Tax=Parashewanella hymeniacidonis TaxID=2807618 RepID=UPI0019613D1B|nr:hypothetical protein [Parashewanella hymeniacidonis]MBM7074250.1 hypothetical protein [Parashewanella hymeniacidonis]